MNKKAIITGLTGQDGSYLAELLLEKGGLLLTRNWDEGFRSTDKLLWKNPRYFLVAAGEARKITSDGKVSAELGKNCWNLENWFGD